MWAIPLALFLSLREFTGHCVGRRNRGRFRRVLNTETQKDALQTKAARVFRTEHQKQVAAQRKKSVKSAKGFSQEISRVQIRTCVWGKHLRLAKELSEKIKQCPLLKHGWQTCLFPQSRLKKLIIHRILNRVPERSYVRNGNN